MIETGIFRKAAVGMIGALMLAFPALAQAEVEFRAQVDRADISQDESVSLKIIISAEGNVSIDGPKFKAPDFDVINDYTSTFIESYYDNGRFGVRNNRQITKVLRPTKNGTLTITGIEARIDGKQYAAPNLTVRVSPGGAGTPPPRNYGGGGVGLRGSGKKARGTGYFVRAEVDKQKAYKGEQVIVSYYLYYRIRVSSPQIDKFPTLNGFLREDLEAPAMGQALNTEQVMLDGVPYQRALLSRYAAYPLKDGKLTIDPLGIKLHYYAREQGAADEDDPVMNFFQHMVPTARIGSAKSDPVSIEVESLPTAGKPENFSGGVGDFSLLATADKTEVKAGEPVTVTLKVEGRGNTASIEEPKVKWPENVELYESKGRAKSNPGGVGERVFEFLLIPRQTGRLTVPAIEMSFFDPDKKEYVTRSTQPIELNVLEGAPGSQRPMGSSQTIGAPNGSNAVASKVAQEPRGLKLTPMANSQLRGQPLWRWMYSLSLAAICLFGGVVAYDFVQRKRGSRESRQMERAQKLLADSKSWQALAILAKKAHQGPDALPWNEVAQAYERLSGALYDAIDRSFGVGARSLSRTELEQVLVQERGIAPEVWQRASRLLEFAETVRFASSTGVVTEASARDELGKWVSEGQILEEAFLRKSARNGSSA